MDVAVSDELAPTLPPGVPDDWFFDRNLPCPTCRYNLRMLRVPRCPECGTVFRWQGLLHVGCPRCGQSLEAVDTDECPRCRLGLNWLRLLQDADPGQLAQYEYTNRPLAAAIRTCLKVMLPRRFWRNMRIESPPAVSRLRRLRVGAVGLSILGLLLAVVENQRVLGAGRDGWEPVFAVASVALILPLVTTIALPLFTPTLARFRIRRDQLLRCLAYGCCGLAWIGLALILAAIAAEVFNTFILTSARPPRGPRPVVFFDPMISLDALSVRGPFRFTGRFGDALFYFNSVVGLLLFVLSFLWWWRFFYVGLRHYLRLNTNNARALFFSTQVIGLLLLARVLLRWDEFAYFVGSFLVGW